MSQCSVLRNYLSAISDNCPSCSLLLILTYYVQFLISFERVLETLSKPPCASLRETGKYFLPYSWQTKVKRSQMLAAWTCWKPHLRQQISTGSLCGVTQVVSGWGRESGVPSSPAHQLSSASHLTLLITWHFWLLFVEFVSWGSHRLHRHRHLQMSPVSFSSSHAGVCEAF